MLKPTIKAEGTTPGEKHLAQLAEKTFIGLWSYPNIYRDEGISKNGTGQEVADLLVCFGDTIIIFSEKDISFKENPDIQVAWGRWYRSSIKDSITQLRGAESFIRSHPTRLFLDKECTLRFPLNIDPLNIKIHLVAVTRNSYDHCKKYFDETMVGSTGSLVYISSFNEEKNLKHPFSIGDFDKTKTFIHVLDEFSLPLLLTELDTISDFIHYLQTKEKCIRKMSLVQILGEEDFLAYYMLNRTSDGYGNFSYAASGDQASVLLIPEGQWNSFKKSLEYIVLSGMKNEGQLWLEILNRFSKSILTANVGEGKNFSIMSHERVMRILASENRASRSILAKALYVKYKSVEIDRRSARLVQSMCVPERLYVFLFVPHDESHVDYEDYRKERLDFMNAYGMVAMYRYPDQKEIVVIGVDTKGSKICSETIIAIDASVPLTSEERSQAQKIMLDGEILNSMTGQLKTTKLNKNVHVAKRRGNIGRNQPCPCGSNKKNKHCCQY
ncbi:SEC-C domain-containing protein [Oxalobacteraceae bacterium OTU3REALA1]|nr:SEC-C domain-containing protein [Oxalobacteraceae bacterium OTU3REALA1]